MSDIEYGMRKHKTKREAFLDSMESLINWDKWCGIIEPIYYKRKPIMNWRIKKMLFTLQSEAGTIIGSSVSIHLSFV